MQKTLLIILFSALLSACSSAVEKHEGMTPFPHKKDLKDEQLFEAATQYITSKDAPPNSVYDFVRVDLNGDGLREGIILFKLPHTYWCGWDGCGMVVFKATTQKFIPMTAMSGVRGPIYIPSTGNMGWRDIIIRTSGTNLRDKTVVMRFNGRNYPSSPMLVPPYKGKISTLKTERFFR